MVFLAAHDKPVLVADIAQAISAPPNFLHQVLNNLARAGLLVCRRGTTRGYELARPAAEISLLNVFEIVEGPLGLTSCTMEGHWCPREGGCTLAAVWNRIQDGMIDVLSSATLDQLAPADPAQGGCPLRVE